ncbi:MAG: hypothetical protein ACRDSH_18970 [Pseudonocardiaceae bacterium]
MYDLGGRVKDTDGLRGILADLYGFVEVDQAATRSWNLSYLAGHTPVLRCRLTGGIAQFADSEWRYERTLKIFPWLGVLSIDYIFESQRVETSMSTFYDGLVEWKNADYLPYLQECGVFTDELAAHTAFTSPVLTQDLHASLVRQLRLRVQPYINPRPAVYAFHDFRACFIDHGSILDTNLVQCLLWLTGPEVANGKLEHVESVQCGSVEIVSTGWSTVLRTDMRTADAEVMEIMSLLSLVHAQWFICQLWINVYDQDFKVLDNTDPAVRVHELSACQLALERDLVEVGNLDVMLKDPRLLRVARSFERSFSVLEHRKAAERRLHVLEDHTRDLVEFSRERATRRLEILFSLSAAGTIAALIPALAQINFPPSFTIITVLLLILLWLGFTINITIIARWLPASRRTRRRSTPNVRPTGDR